jgi:broad specificity phosphatase PhoE
MLLTLIRHGEVEGRPWVFRGHSDPPLSSEGWANMRAAVQALPRASMKIVSSDLCRCRVFAEAWAQEIGTTCTVDPRLREINFGAWEELNHEEVQHRFADNYAVFCSNPEGWAAPGGEHFNTFRERVASALDDLYRWHTREHVVLVTHGGVIRVVLSIAQALSFQAALQIEVRHASATQVWYEPAPSRARTSPPCKDI